jgi:hypothetical protein
MSDDQAAPFGYIIFCLVIGVFLIVIPWHSIWEANFLLSYVPALRSVMLNNYLRGAVSGLGAIDIVLGMAALARLIRPFGVRHPQPSDESTHPSATHPE